MELNKTNHFEIAAFSIIIAAGVHSFTLGVMIGASLYIVYLFYLKLIEISNKLNDK